MKTIISKYILLISLLFLFITSNLSTAIAIPVKDIPIISLTVNRIIDGDTIVLSSGQHIRFYCMDAPEHNQLPQGPLAINNLKSLLPTGTPIQLKAYNLDRYGRTVGEIYKGAELINLTLVKTGEAVVYTEYCKVSDYYDAEKIAKASKLGIWKESNPTMPWDFRKTEKEKVQ